MAARLILIASALLQRATAGGGGGGGDASPGAVQLDAVSLASTAASSIATGGALFVRFYLNG
jgi:hypothetical protein